MRLIYFLILSFIFDLSIVKSNDIIIKYKINNEIITNQDIKNEIKYLVALNNNLASIDQNKLYEMSSKSIIREKIKYLELVRYFDLEKKNENIDKIIFENLNLKLNLNSENDVKLFLKSKDINFQEIYNKLKIELFWNKLIYDKYLNKVSINKDKLRNKIIIESQKQISEEFFLKEILFDIDESEDFDTKYKLILDTISQKNFESAANLYSIAGTSQNGGAIGWVKKTSLSEKIISKISSFEVGEVSKPLAVGNGFLILKLENKRNIKLKVNVEKELDLLIRKETDRQLNLFSTNYLNKIKKNIYINEL